MFRDHCRGGNVIVHRTLSAVPAMLGIQAIGGFAWPRHLVSHPLFATSRGSTTPDFRIGLGPEADIAEPSPLMARPKSGHDSRSSSVSAGM